MQMPSLYSGWAGLQSHSDAMSSVADNLANQSTTGYKSTRPEFHDFISNALYEGTSSVQQVGNGSYMQTQYMMAQGAVTQTDNALDMAISGSGFFALKPATTTYPGGPATGSKGSTFYYSRDGAFTMDANGYIVNSEGYILQGSLGAGGGAGLADIKITTSQTAGAATSEVDMALNLDASDTNTHAQITAIDPTDKTTYNYSYTTTVYDDAGEAHQISTFYQHLTSYGGPAPAGSAHVWKAASFEYDNGVYTANPISPDNVYYLHFDTNGLLVGTSTSISAKGDTYYFSAGVTGGASNVSNQLGEALTYTGAGIAQTYLTTASVTFGGAGASIGDHVSIGGDTYTFASALGANASANWLAEQINANPAHTYYASANAGVVTLHAKAGSAANVTVSGANLACNDNTTLNSVVSAINNGVAASGAIDLTSLAAGDTITVAGHIFTQGTDFTDAATLAAAINGAGLGLGASSNGGNDVFLTAFSVGSAGNALTLAASGGIAVSSATLLGGLDDSSTSLVAASTYVSGGQTHLQLARTDVGATATLTLAASNTLGSGLALDFSTATQTAAATDASSSSETEGQASLTYALNGGTQTIVWNYNPTSGGHSTQSAGDDEVVYLYQDGFASGELQSLSVDTSGYIHGHYSNGQDLVLAGVSLSLFKSPGEMERVGDNLWLATTAAGIPKVGLPGDETMGLGTIEGGALENSNVDLATEFVRMINYQRAYQANSKSISTSDEMLKDAINLKR